MELLEAELELQSHESLWVNGSGEAARGHVFTEVYHSFSQLPMQDDRCEIKE